MSTFLAITIDKRATNPLKTLMLGLMVLLAAMLSVKPVSARPAPESFADLVEKLQPAVVNISTVQTIERSEGKRPELPEGLPFGDFWDQFRDRFEEDNEPRTARSLGSGFIIDPTGIVITNNHVVEEADEITVLLEDGEEYSATVLGRDSLSDVAVLKIEPKEKGQLFPAVKWGDSDVERIGDWVVAIGNPFGLGGTVSAGIVSARNRTINAGDIEFIQTDAPINRGNSGGPLFNMKGEVIGVNTAIFSPTGGNVGIGFSIPSNDAARVTRELKEHGKVRRGWLGVGIQPMTKELAEAMGADITKGAIVTRVEPDSPAAKADIQEGDVIFRWDGKPVDDSTTLSRLVKRTDVDVSVDVQVLRKGKTVTLKVKTGELKIEADASGKSTGKKSDDNMEDSHTLIEGMELAPLNDTIRRKYNIDAEVEGVAVTRVAQRSPAFHDGIRPGAVIVRVNQIAVSSPAEVAKLVEEARAEGRERILVLVYLRGNSAHIPMKLLKEKDQIEE
ncbi:Do family serine endopeptidase [Kordiimonas pumila]|uniref:Probable periplasmic serine endoprotease DegP-like n=1 Tax=Kordiimonas pumila TaxID=2161677 RepID=A0ABV7D8R5_9PROT|nr:Do family serine endopeptidase [Kordiimonas pumila]